MFSLSGVDFQSVAVHELGHSLGLAHSPVFSSIMFPYYKGPSESKDLNYDDVMAMYELYSEFVVIQCNRFDSTYRPFLSSVKNVLNDDRNTLGPDATSTIATTSEDSESFDYDDEDEYDFGQRTVKPPLRNPVATTARPTTFSGDFETVDMHKVGISEYMFKMRIRHTI